jgi:hypothetical protein
MERGCPHPQHAKVRPEAKDFNGVVVATRCGWDSRAPNNFKLGHHHLIAFLDPRRQSR